MKSPVAKRCVIKSRSRNVSPFGPGGLSPARAAETAFGTGMDPQPQTWNRASRRRFNSGTKRKISRSSTWFISRSNSCQSSMERGFSMVH